MANMVNVLDVIVSAGIDKFDPLSRVSSNTILLSVSQLWVASSRCGSDYLTIK